MTLEQIIIGTLTWGILISICHYRITWRKVRECYGMWFTKEYWTDYNTVEFVSWFAKAMGTHLASSSPSDYAASSL